MIHQHRLSALMGVLLLSANANAIEIAFERDDTLPIIHMNVAIKTGSVSDPEGQYGITNFVGEMLLRGTRSRNKEQIDLELDQMGARIAIETRAEALIVRGSVLSGEIGPFLKLLTDLITQPSFPEQEVRKLKAEIVSQLLEERSSDASLSQKAFASFLFGSHPYGKPVDGNISDVEKITKERALAHFDRLFRDKQMVVIGSGDVGEAQIREWANALALARPGDVIVPKVTPPQAPAKRRLLIVDKPDRTQTQIDAGLVGVRMTDKNFFPLYLANHAYGGASFSARLTVEIRVKRGWSYGAYSYFKHGRQPRFWQYHLYPAAKYTPEALGHSITMLEKLHQEGISPDEFTFNQKSLVKSAGFMYNTPKKRIENALLERTLDLPDGFIKSFGPNLTKVTLDEVNAAAREFFDPAKLSITVLGTAKDLRDALIKNAGINPEDVKVMPYDAN